jgi:hypothetical protein
LRVFLLPCGPDDIKVLVIAGLLSRGGGAVYEAGRPVRFRRRAGLFRVLMQLPET